MFKEFFLKELIGGLKRPMVWIFFTIFGLLSGLAVSSDSVTIGGAIGNVHKNSPDVITQFVLVFSIFGLLIAAAFFNNAALRDVRFNFNEIMFSLPIKKSGYFWGRFLGALILSTVPFLGVFAGVIIGSALSPVFDWADAERYGGYQISYFLNNYLLFVVPNMLIGGSIIFFLAHKWKNTIVSFVGALVVIIIYVVTGNIASDIENQQLAALLDIFGIRTHSYETRYWTPAEKNTLAPAFQGVILYNRLIWLGVAMVLSAISYKVFSFTVKKSKTKKKEEIVEEKTVIEVERVRTWQGHFGSGLGWKQFVSFYKTNTQSVLSNNVFKILFLFSAILLAVDLVQGYEYYGLQSYPLTYQMTESISGSTVLFIQIIVVFFSGELVWRDRMSNIHEVINATPHNSFSALLAKAGALITSATILYFFFILLAITAQLIYGFTRIELDVYFLDFLLQDFPRYIVFSALFIVVQTLMTNRYIGYFVSIMLIFVWEILLGLFDVSSNMISFVGTPSVRYSDLNGFGPGVTGAMWFNTYWILFGLMMLYIAGIFWPRSVVSGFKERMKAARAGLDKRTILPFAGIIGLWVLVASFVFYNTQMLNSYKSGDELEEISAEYEKQLKKYDGIPMPKVTELKMAVDIYPEARNVKVHADVTIENQTDGPIDSLHFNINEDWETEIIIPGAELVYDDKYLEYRIYKLKKPLQSGETLEMQVNNDYITAGFSNNTGNTSIVENGTFLNSFGVLPGFGYNDGVELGDKYTRKKYGLKPKKRTADLEDPCGEKCMVNYLSDGVADWVKMETVISTSSDQVAIAPGSLVKEWTEGDRRYFNYKVDTPSQLFLMFMSARYEVAREKYNGIDMEVYYDKKHDYNIELMLDAMKRSVDYYETHFGKYYHKQMRIIEFPRYSTFAQAFPGTMPYAESFGFITNLEDEEGNNVIDAVIAHEIAHQWWAHQEVSASMQGGTMLTESFSEYSSLMVMKNDLQDDMRMVDFLKYDYQRYLGGRSSESQKELPLYKVENQGYIHYGKGSIILYSLQDYIGEDNVNLALRNFLEEYRYKAPPYPTSIDFLRHLDPVVPDSMKYLIDDYFKKITLYDYRLMDASMVEEDGQYAVTFDIEAYKMYADTLGNESPAELNEWVDVGVFADVDKKDLIAYDRIYVGKEKFMYTLYCDRKPVKAAIDPRRVVIERVIDDNVKSLN